MQIQIYYNYNLLIVVYLLRRGHYKVYYHLAINTVYC
nr:MAG TPA: hypothetical protein [Caudoviricetes sp.]